MVVMDSKSIFEFTIEPHEIAYNLPMIAGLSGFTDAGSTVSQFAEHVFANLDHELVVEFRNDDLLDYRSRRPVMQFDKDHIASYEPPILGIYLVRDETGAGFLFLHGYEPDFRWEQFTDVLISIIERLKVSNFCWVHSIPFPLPHTRPIGVTVSGNRRDLIDSISEWKPQTQVPGNVIHLIEYKLSKLGLPTVGFVYLVPHYLGESEYPAVAVLAIEHITVATGVVIPTDQLRDQNAVFISKLDEQISQNADLAKMISNLEAGYTNDSAGLTRTSIIRPSVDLPTADEIANELEDYLASRRKNQADENS
jgi:hypothetical protein